MTKPTLISLVSGKGGTGKSIVCALLGRMLAQEAARVLLVDLDLFVRGLTYFVYSFKKERRVITEDATVADYYSLTDRNLVHRQLARERFFEVDLVPAVSEIEAQLDYLRIEAETVKKTSHFFDELRDQDFDYILIDNRAGVDEMILEGCRASDLVISVTEADSVAQVTNENLLRHLKSQNVGKVYTVINKAKQIETYKDYQRAMQQIRSDFDLIGQIPFDVDFFQDFGTSRFWHTAHSTRFTYALAEAWNQTARRENFSPEIDMERFRPGQLWPGRKESPTFLKRAERYSLLIGSAALLGYIGYKLATEGFALLDSLLLYAVALLFLPALRSFMR